MKDPAFLFYSDNFLSGTMFFSDEQVGKYIRLLCAQHLTGHLKENHMIFICKSYDQDIFEKFSKDENGLYFNERLEEEVLRRRKYSESRSENKKGKIKEPKKLKNISRSYDSHMGTETETEIESIISSFSSDFQKNWKELISLPKWKKKPETAIKKALDQLLKYEEEFSIKLMEKAISGNYQGVIFSNTETDYSNWKQTQNGKTFKSDSIRNDNQSVASTVKVMQA